MSESDLPVPIYIDTSEKLIEAVRAWENEPLLAIDTESNSLHAYREQVCLVQFSVPTGDYLLDPLAVTDLSPLAPIFCNPNVVKIFHAAEYDVICMKRDFGFEFVNLFDTMVAARILGWEKVGLGSILEMQFGVKLNKKHQRADWGERPLTSDMLNYAQYDTHYLIALRKRLLDELAQKDLMALADEDFERVRHVNGKARANDDELCWRVKGARDLAPQQAAILQKLCLYREKVAAKLNRPVFKVIGNATMIAVAEAAPRDKDALRNVSGVRHWFMRRHADPVLREVRAGLRAEPIHFPKKVRPSDAYLNRLDAIRFWRKTRAQALKIQSDVVLPKDVMQEIVRVNPATQAELVTLMATVPWRLERYGEEILSVLHKNNSDR